MNIQSRVWEPIDSRMKGNLAPGMRNAIRLGCTCPTVSPLGDEKNTGRYLNPWCPFHTIDVSTKEIE